MSGRVSDTFLLLNGCSKCPRINLVLSTYIGDVHSLAWCSKMRLSEMGMKCQRCKNECGMHVNEGSSS